MWYLTATNDKRTIYVVPENNVTIGRSVDTQFCNFALPEDPSISRKHATLFVSDSHLYLQDLGSKYGTFINDNGDKLEHNAKIKLNCNDIVKFGKMGSIWKVNNISFITCTSTLKSDQVQILKNALAKVGGVLKSDWDETCMFLTMPTITLTIKVVLALVQSAQIVNIEYWNKCVEAIKNHSTLPNPDHFVPHISESTINKEDVSFLPLIDRKSLFAGKQVIFFSRRQFEMYKNPLQKSSGTPLLLSETKMSKSMLCEDNVIVIQYNITLMGQDTQSQRDQINEINSYLKSKGKRLVADAEIGLAILYCSFSKYCNPDFSFSIEVIKHVPTSSKGTILAQETQEHSQKLKKENVVIDESLTPQNHDSQINNKRKLSDDSDNSNSSNVFKKIALDDTSSSGSNKRVCEESNESVPSKKVALDDNNEEIFNFLEAPETSTKRADTNKMLNLFKPLKRKLDERDNEDDLFNFVEEKQNTTDKPVLNSELPKKLKIEKDIHDTNQNNTEPNHKIDLETLRGSKLKELMEFNANLQNFKNIKDIKKEETEIDEQIKHINLGSTTLVVNKDLIIKREPLPVTTLNEERVKNFKKFKKVWPVKFQVTLVSNVSRNSETMNKISNEEGNSMSV